MQIYFTLLVYKLQVVIPYKNTQVHESLLLRSHSEVLLVHAQEVAALLQPPGQWLAI